MPENLELKFVDIIKSLKICPKIIKKLWTISNKEVLLIALFSILNGIIPSLNILSMQQLINSIQMSNTEPFNKILFWLLFFAIMNIIGNWLTTILAKKQDLFSLKIDYYLNLEILLKSNKLHLKSFEDEKVYNMIKRAQNAGAQRIIMVFQIFCGIISQIVKTVAIFCIIANWSILIALISITIPLISLFFNMKIGNIKFQIDYNRTDKNRQTWYFSYLLTNDIAFKEIKIHQIGNYLIKKFHDITKKFIIQDKGIIIKRSKISYLFGLLSNIVFVIIVYIITKRAYLSQILIGDAVTYINSIKNINDTSKLILDQLTAVYQNSLYIAQFFEFIEYQESEDLIKGEGIELKKIYRIKSIEFKEVTFFYKSSKVLDKVSFKINVGEKVAIIGKNGSGKTTIIKLMLGLYENYGGEIFINEISLKLIDKNSLWKTIGVIFQDFMKYELSLRENVGFGNISKMKNDKKIKYALKKGCNDNQYSFFEGNIDMMLGAWFGGRQLSGGQWQGVALSRAFLKDGSCYILDEPTAALDPISEYQILKKMKHLTENKISIFITHRIENIKRIASRVIFIKEGRVVGNNTHEELLKECKEYNEFYSISEQSNIS